MPKLADFGGELSFCNLLGANNGLMLLFWVKKQGFSLDIFFVGYEVRHNRKKLKINFLFFFFFQAAAWPVRAS